MLFAAVDGIRYGHVTGVQTCALPISIQGTVTDAATGESLPGVNIVVKGAETIGTSSNQDGTFELDVPSLKWSPTSATRRDRKSVVEGKREERAGWGGSGGIRTGRG